MGSSVILPPAGQPTQGPDPGFKTGSFPNIVTFNFDKIAPPSQVYIQRDDRIHVKIMNSFPSPTVVLSGRILLPQGPVPGQPDAPASEVDTKSQTFRGWVDLIQQTMVPDATRSPNEFDFQVAEGYLLSLAVGIFGAPGTQRGQTFVTAGLQRGALSGARFQQLIADYAAGNMDLAWPGGPIRTATEGPGFIHSIQQANPAAGADWTFTAALGQRVRISSLAAVLTASAAAANRQVELIVDDGANVVWRTSAQANVTASQAATFAATGTNVPPGVITLDQEFVLPPTLILAPGWRIRTLTTGIQAGDQWSAIWLNVEEWINM